jgi:hypothetical protein
MVLRREDPELVLDAIAYVEAVHRDLTAENTAPSSGVEGRVIAAIRADPAYRTMCGPGRTMGVR